MDENASRAVFIGVSVFVAIITITLIVNFYRTAKDSAAVANRYDLTETGSSKVNEILSKDKITGLELRYLLNYYYNDTDIQIYVYQPDVNDKFDEENARLSVNSEEYWSDQNQQYLDENIRPNFNYGLAIDNRGRATVIVATFEN